MPRVGTSTRLLLLVNACLTRNLLLDTLLFHHHTTQVVFTDNMARIDHVKKVFTKFLGCSMTVRTCVRVAVGGTKAQQQDCFASEPYRCCQSRYRRIPWRLQRASKVPARVE